MELNSCRNFLVVDIILATVFLSAICISHLLSFELTFYLAREVGGARFVKSLRSGSQHVISCKVDCARFIKSLRSGFRHSILPAKWVASKPILCAIDKLAQSSVVYNSDSTWENKGNLSSIKVQL